MEEATTGALPKIDAAAAAMGQWAGGQPKGLRRVVVDESAVGPSWRERREDEEGEDDESRIPVARSTDTEGEVGRQSAEKGERGAPVFEDMEEPTVEVVVWTTAREEALKNVTAE